MNSITELRYRHPRQAYTAANTADGLQSRDQIALQATNLLRPDENIRRIADATDAQRAYAVAHARAPRHQVAALQRSTNAWDPVMNKHAVAPLALITAHNGVRWLMYRTEDAVSAAAKNSLGASLTVLVCQFTLQWFVAEAFRIAAEPMKQKWEDASRKKALAYAEAVNRNDIRGWAVEETRNKVNTAAVQIPEKTKAATEFVYGTASDMLSLALYLSNIWGSLAAGAISAPTLVGPMLGAALLYAMSGRQGRLAKREQEAKSSLETLTATYADNVQLGNAYNLDQWQREKINAERNYQSAFWARQRNAAVTELCLVGINGASVMLPYGMSFRELNFDSLTRKQIDNLPKTVTRMNQICHRGIDLGKDFILGVNTTASLRALKSSVDARSPEQLADRITQMLANCDSFSIRNPEGRIVPLQEFLDNVDDLLRPGRWTVRARNGTGKSTLLNLLKILHPDAVHYVPVKHSLKHQVANGSAGQTQIRQLAEVISNVRAPILALDEWPANLDVANTAGIDGVLQQYARHACVLEVRNDEDQRLAE